MKLSDFNQTSKKTAVKALREHYGIPFNVDRLNGHKASTLLRGVKTAITETKNSANYRSLNKSELMKLVFMEQALSARLSELRAMRPRLVIENKEVQRSQSMVAAQEMVNSIQKMIEQVSDMVVKELPALSDSIESDIDVNMGNQFNQTVGEALKGLQQTLEQTRDSLNSALDSISGEGGEQVADFGAEMGGEEGMEPEGEMPAEPEAEMPAEPEGEMPEMPEEPEEPEASVGRRKR